MNDDFKQDLLQQIDSIESEIDYLNHELEEDESIPKEKWKQYDLRISRLYTLLQRLKEDIYFT